MTDKSNTPKQDKHETLVCKVNEGGIWAGYTIEVLGYTKTSKGKVSTTLAVRLLAVPSSARSFYVGQVIPMSQTAYRANGGKDHAVVRKSGQSLSETDYIAL